MDKISDLKNIVINTLDINKAQDIFKNSRTDANGFPYGGVVQDYKSMDRYVQ